MKRWGIVLVVVLGLTVPAAAQAELTCHATTVHARAKHWVRVHGRWVHESYIKVEHRQVCGPPEVGRLSSILFADQDSLEVYASLFGGEGQYAPPYAPPARGAHFDVIYLSLTNLGGALINSDADGDTTVIGSNGATYTTDFESLGGACTNFDYGSFSLLPAGHATGCVVFEIPDGVVVQSVRFSLGLGVEDQWST